MFSMGTCLVATRRVKAGRKELATLFHEADHPENVFSNRHGLISSF